MQYSKEIILKNKNTCLLRNGDRADGRQVLDVFNQTHAETDYLLTYPDESSFTAEQEAEFLAQKTASPNEIEICAVVDGRIVGTAGIEAVGSKDKVKHRAELGIAIEKASWGLGIGKALMEACIDCARQAGYAQLELDVVAENTAALTLYKKLGFVEFGRNPKGFRSRLTGWQELVYLRLEL